MIDATEQIFHFPRAEPGARVIERSDLAKGLLRKLEPEPGAGSVTKNAAGLVKQAGG